jgi:hypothetical protein
MVWRKPLFVIEKQEPAMTALIKIGPAAATAIMRASPWNTPEMTNSTVLLATFFGRKRIGTFDRLGSAKYNQNNAAQSF